MHTVQKQIGIKLIYIDSYVYSDCHINRELQNPREETIDLNISKVLRCGQYRLAHELPCRSITEK